MADAEKAKTAKPKAAAAPKAAPKAAAKPAAAKPKPKPAAKAPAKAPAKTKVEAPVVEAKAAEPKPVAKTKAKPERVRRAPGTPPAIVRPERKTREGLVVSAKMEKTVVVKIERRVQHPLYGKVVLRTKHFKAHDVIGCDEGDRVEIMETRPISKQKRWRVTQILEKVK